MSGEITKAALMGARVSIFPDCYPRPGGAKYIQVSMTKLTWNGTTTLNRKIPVGPAPEQMDAAIEHTIMEMAGTIELPHNWKG